MTRDEPEPCAAWLSSSAAVRRRAGRGAVFFSVIAFIAALITRNLPYSGSGSCVGIVGMVVPFVGMSRSGRTP